MPFDWREFLIVAHRLRNDTSEGAQRTCLGRAYYYAYNHGLAKARAMNFTGQMPSLHKQLWSWCQNHQDPIIKRMGVEGSRMHSFRIDADYEPVSIQNLAGRLQKQFSRAQVFEGLVAQSNGQQPPPPLGP